jgi:uncharacterized membrane protein YkgB
VLFQRADRLITLWLARHGVVLLRVALGIVFFWFGVLKFWPGLSSAEKLALDTIQIMTFGLVPPDLARVTLAAWECVIGLGLMTGIALRATLFLLAAQMVGTVTPLFLFPELTFAKVPWAPTLEGQYIIKNVVLVTAAFVVGATVRGGNLVADERAVALDVALEREQSTQPAAS